MKNYFTLFIPELKFLKTIVREVKVKEVTEFEKDTYGKESIFIDRSAWLGFNGFTVLQDGDLNRYVESENCDAGRLRNILALFDDDFYPENYQFFTVSYISTDEDIIYEGEIRVIEMAKEHYGNIVDSISNVEKDYLCRRKYKYIKELNVEISTLKNQNITIKL